MSLAFPCPSCRVQIEVADELAGQTGQCPRCEHVFTVPSPVAPKPIVVAKAIPEEPAKAPASRRWAEEKRRDDDDEWRPRRSQRSATKRPRPEPQPRGPVWPWLVGILGALVVGGLLFSSFIVLIAYRKPFTPQVDLSLPASAKKTQRVIVGRLEGKRAFFQDGAFQVRTSLSQSDPADLENPLNRAKRFDVELTARKIFIIEMDDAQFDGVIRVERANHLLKRGGFFGVRNPRVDFTPPETQVYTIYVTSMAPNNGSFTLTIRESGVPKPAGPR